MKFSTCSIISILFLLPLQSVHGHGLITAVTGANGVTGVGFGVDAATPRDGSTPKPFEQDTSIIRDVEIKTGKTGPCGRTKLSGNNDVATQLEAASTAGLPSAAADGTVTMTLHQVNQDGAGPYTCAVSADGTGADFVAMDVTQNVPGVLSLSKAKATNFTLIAAMPAGTTCTGGPNGDACLVRCRNGAVAGPFGGCAAVTNPGTAASNATASVTEAASAADTAAALSTTDAAASSAVVTSAAATSAAVASPASTSAVVRRNLRSRVVGRALAGRWI
ncbi:hypothetical protein PUNSTDRAFT_135487 [Punctularia strigosozonata HHB-11173 SS5]|uniref:uncharacterized protein n=1 Tax=Punctularia strigosozonata (strain HHB-11173) TaxID=741275 RepID=UPI0004418643|nr:uncharacterized protein PUNSTDRAFT_135487 [Punctularia strigosozonata HHB-11173 SS5]EIN07970.1 hypothetical protein PUNSTDRAFT_135487 [Punctularia strigosozonata HHB-11173 SS5]